MMPTLKQIKKLNQLLLDVHAMHVAPSFVKFSERKKKPLIILALEPIKDLREVRWYTIDMEGNIQ